MNEFGFGEYDKDFVQPGFIIELKKETEQHSFDLVQEDPLTETEYLGPCRWVFRNQVHDVTVIYYTSVAVPHHLKQFPRLHNDLADSHTLIIRGHHPDHQILDYMKNVLDLICYTGTVYSKTLQVYEEEEIPDNEFSVFRHLLKDTSNLATISLYDAEKRTLQTFATYQDFYKAFEQNREIVKNRV